MEAPQQLLKLLMGMTSDLHGYSGGGGGGGGVGSHESKTTTMAHNYVKMSLQLGNAQTPMLTGRHSEFYSSGERSRS